MAKKNKKCTNTLFWVSRRLLKYKNPNFFPAGCSRTRLSAPNYFFGWRWTHFQSKVCEARTAMDAPLYLSRKFGAHFFVLPLFTKTLLPFLVCFCSLALSAFDFGLNFANLPHHHTFHCISRLLPLSIRLTNHVHCHRTLQNLIRIKSKHACAWSLFHFDLVNKLKWRTILR